MSFHFHSRVYSVARFAALCVQTSFRSRLEKKVKQQERGRMIIIRTTSCLHVNNEFVSGNEHQEAVNRLRFLTKDQYNIF